MGITDKQERLKVECFGAPFETRYSSCSNRKPETFDWTIEDSSIKVDIDREIMSAVVPEHKRVAWICESPAIIPDVMQFCRENADVLKQKYHRVYTCDKSLVLIDPEFFNWCPNGSNLSWIPSQNSEIKNLKSKLCSMFCSRKIYCDGHKKRHFYSNKFKGKIDLFGAYGASIGQNNTPWPDKRDGLVPYMFSVVVENCVCDSYLTEKLTDCFASYTVPVYLGCPDVKFHHGYDERGIIRLEENFDPSCLTRELYESMSEYVIKNHENTYYQCSADDTLVKLIKESDYYGILNRSDKI